VNGSGVMIDSFVVMYPDPQIYLLFFIRKFINEVVPNSILVGYKGKQKVDWIAEKVGEKGEDVIRVATAVHLNQSRSFLLLDYVKLYLVLGIGQTLSSSGLY
jgi:hypothetical protein